jgi:hypothetical protein
VFDPERADIVWVKSSLSESGQCVEVAITAEWVALRNSYNPSGPVVAFTQEEWAAFVGGVRLGEFDGPSATL